jgi:hypothetical protein
MVKQVKIYKLYCAELRYECFYDDVQQMFDSMREMMEEDGVGLVFHIEVVWMSQRKYNTLAESTGW